MQDIIKTYFISNPTAARRMLSVTKWIDELIRLKYQKIDSQKLLERGLGLTTDNQKRNHKNAMILVAWAGVDAVLEIDHLWSYVTLRDNSSNVKVNHVYRDWYTQIGAFNNALLLLVKDKRILFVEYSFIQSYSLHLVHRVIKTGARKCAIHYVWNLINKLSYLAWQPASSNTDAAASWDDNIINTLDMLIKEKAIPQGVLKYIGVEQWERINNKFIDLEPSRERNILLKAMRLIK